MLRHPVVLTTVDEDFRKFGLIKESKGEKTAPKDEDKEPVGDPSEEELERDPDEELDEEELEALAEAEAFAEEFDEDFEALGHESEFRLDLKDMEDLEDCGDSVELPYGVIESEQDASSEDEKDEAFTRVHKMSSAERAAERKRKRSPKAKAAARKYLKKASVQRAMKKHRAKVARMGGTRKGYRMVSDTDLDTLSDAVSSLVDDVNLEDSELAISAFANVALIAERLYEAFKGSGDEAIAEGYAELAKHAAGVVEFLEGDEEVDMEALEEQFGEFISVLEPGVEAYDAMFQEDEDDEENPPVDENEGEDENLKKSGGEQEQE